MNEFDIKARDWDNNPQHAERAKTIAWEIKKAVSITHDMTGFEYGCGTGQLSFNLAGVLKGGKTEAGFMSRGVCHGASDHVSGDRPRGARQATMAADRLHVGRDYAWRGARRIIVRSDDIAVRNTPAAGRCVRTCAFVTSDGIGGTDGFGGAVPLFVTSDGIGGTDGFGGAVPLGDGRGRVVAGPGSGWGAAGSGMVSSLGAWGSAAASSATAGRRPAGTLRRRISGCAAASRRPAGPASAAGSRGSGRPLSRWPYGRHRRVHAS